ncbi:MAG: phosphoenolpyruvate synthase [Patescibacteria group bacterium]|nr:phosphoenolpyruvate synthase [Patescibacteria group bacterium]MDD5121370.1 phosphoenolpyruvate synthase [Patescibacteria group bacterium]MDD5221777.1 phosphoenolpyruvate synthase [Patescibacteria group bacterium]MDD5395711.1 phosphoenolpyruvate synthase [Patescibacteria group bacterium]
MSKDFVLPFKNLRIKDISRVGGKNASLGEMFTQLTKHGLRVPDGFATTAEAYRYFLAQTGLDKKIKKALTGLDIKNLKDLAYRGKTIRQMISATPLPEKLTKEVLKYYRQLSKKYDTENLDVAVRSSATAEDLPGASFAGAQESYLNISGEGEVLKAVRLCIASLFTDRAIVYRVEQGFDHLKTALSVGVQKMVRSDLAYSGVMFSCDTESGFADVTVINSSWGLGENIVKGRVTPDEFMVYEPLLTKGYQPIIKRKLGSKEVTMIYNKASGRPTKNLTTPIDKRQKFTLTDSEILELARYSITIEKHYGRPMDIEWAKDGHDKSLYIIQARPETVQSKKNVNVLEEYVFDKSAKNKKVLLEGIAIGSKIGQGEIRVIKNVKEIEQFKPGQILVTKMTDPDWVPVMKMAKAIITDEGGRTCHAAIVSRELGVPCVVGSTKATQILRSGQKVTVSCAEGERGIIYQGILPFTIKKTSLKGLYRPKVKIMMNVGEPDQAFNFSFIPSDGVGLAREEFIINNYIGIHPLALLNFSKMPASVKKQVKQITAGYSNKTQFYVDKLAEGIGRIAAAFYPKDVIVRFSDFKSNEYANLIGGKLFEPVEQNPMIGWRGASRYYDQKFKAAFDLECRAIKKVREIFGLDNVIAMVPFCRTIEEGQKVISIINAHGLKKQKAGLKPLKVYVMAEIPSNIILAEEFSKIFDGFSIGSNDLAQLTLGLDRDSGIISHIANEKNEAVKILIRQLIKIAHQYKRKVGICGQAPSDFPDFAKFLVKEGIDSISLNPDTVIKTTMALKK